MADQGGEDLNNSLYVRVAILEATLVTISKHMDKIDALTKDMAEVRTAVAGMEKSRLNPWSLVLALMGWAVALGVGLLQ